MLYTLLVGLFVFICLLLVLVILIQPGKGNMGLGSIGGGNQMLFGGSGGQDIFQQITWILSSIFMGGSLLLSITRASTVGKLRLAKNKPLIEQHQTPRPR
jgi:preprotein translocase subunit SecG